tara:strand:- start:342 stop:578 length:237 start_codon:yes stop_codon:yes gene_type:complete
LGLGQTKKSSYLAKGVRGRTCGVATAESMSTAQQKIFPTPQAALMVESKLDMLGCGTGDGDGVGVGRGGSVAAVPNMK